MTFRQFKDGEDFVKNYPFAPYQFQLVQKIFEAIRRAGATGMHLARGERSMLDAFQSAAKTVSMNEVGVLVPLYDFYPSIESFLDTSVKKTIDQAETNPGLEPFDIRLLQVLFLIRYVDEMKGNVDNLVTLCLDQIDGDRLALRHQIEESLGRLEKETLISRSGENYFFLTNEERDINKEIKAVELSSGEEAKLVGEIIFEDVLKGQRKHRFRANKMDFDFNRRCDQYPIGNQKDGALLVSVITPLADDYELYDKGKCHPGKHDRRRPRPDPPGQRREPGPGTAGLPPDRKVPVPQERRHPVGIDQAHPAGLRRGQPPAAGTAGDAPRRDAGRRPNTSSPASRSSSRRQRRGRRWTRRWSTSSRTRSARWATSSGSPPSRSRKSRPFCAATTSPRNKLLFQTGENKPEALEDLRSYLQLCSLKSQPAVVLHDMLEKRYALRPYGWPDEEVLLLVARLVVLSEISLMMDSTLLPIDKVYEAITAPAKRRKIVCASEKPPTPRRSRTPAAWAKTCSPRWGRTARTGLSPSCKTSSRAGRRHSTGTSRWPKPATTPARRRSATASLKINTLLAVKESNKFIERFNTLKNDLLDLADQFHDLEHFYDHQKPTWEKLRKAHAAFQLNRLELEKDAQAGPALKRMQEILSARSPYGLIKEADALINTVNVVNSSLLTGRRTQAVARIDALIATLNKDIAAAQGEAGLRAACLKPLEALKEQVQKEESLAHVTQAEAEAVKEFDAAVGRSRTTCANWPRKSQPRTTGRGR